MINFKRVFAMVLRYTYNLKHSLDRLSDMFYWPLLDLLIWGVTGLYLARLNVHSSSNYLFIILNGLIFWIIVWRAQYEINTNLLSELWDKNILNLFVSPLKIQEWILSFMIFGFIKSLISMFFSASIAFLLYGYNIFQYGPWLLIFLTSLLLTGWAGGFLVAGFLIRYGERIQTLAWGGIAIIIPFSALYYPVSVLPTWAQKVALFFPSSYVFESLRDYLFTKQVHFDKLFVSFGLNVIYLTLALIFFRYMFNKSKKLGIGRLI